MRKKMERLAKELSIRSSHSYSFTETPFKVANFVEGERYFIVQTTSDEVVRAWKTQQEAVFDLQDILQKGVFRTRFGEVYLNKYKQS
ncbi:hypothetical protein [[Clostridium] polysaccharolyticum]|uniref:Uncharacterized protein n=1 Tax=[Clostridium] polysaccharolyticum TaxID=29364 RepID=A0A1H9YGX1_9FIRM|nr:hypothetical protein [[Clostridium] polysaccharolyticum]SES68292.1 hypothetical protein SAMN04487772_10214 [[Clostridium] polysaccharolyticum]